MTHFLLLYVFYRIPELFCICLHLGILLTSDRNIPIRDQFSQILRLMTDLQYLQTVTASEGSISDILYTLRQGHLFQERPFAECPSADKFHFFRKLQLVCCTEIKSFFPDIFQIRREMNVRSILQRRKALFPICCILSGRSIFSSVLHSIKASTPILVRRLQAANSTF